MTAIIAIETATEACSAALLIQNQSENIVYKRFQLAPREHTKLILPMLDEVLLEADLKIANVDAIAFGRGPGAFTGLRIATGIAQGLALAIDKPTVAVSSLQSMALAAQKEASHIESIIVAIDARMGEVYWAEYKRDGVKVELVGEEQLSKPAVMFEKAKTLLINNSVVVIGSGWDEYIQDFENKDAIELSHIEQKFPDAAEVSELALELFNKGEYQSVEGAQPVYLRNNVAEKSKK